MDKIEKITLDLTNCKYIRDFHERIRVAFNFPEWYGKNLDALWDADSRFVDDNTLSVHVSRLREKLGDSHIKTIRGVGYQWVD